MGNTDHTTPKLSIDRRNFLGGAAAAGIGASGLFNAGSTFAQSSKAGTVRVWGEPGPYGGVAVAAMNEWAQKNAPGLKFEIETIPWDGVYVKLMTEHAARARSGAVAFDSAFIENALQQIEILSHA